MSRLALLSLVVIVGCGRAERPGAQSGIPLGNPVQGKLLIAQHGCTVCHTIQGLEPKGRIGPHLNGIAERSTLSNGSVPNSPDNLVRFIQNPAALNPRTFMPAAGLSPGHARDIAAYLMTID